MPRISSIVWDLTRNKGHDALQGRRNVLQYRELTAGACMRAALKWLGFLG